MIQVRKCKDQGKAIGFTDLLDCFNVENVFCTSNICPNYEFVDFWKYPVWSQLSLCPKPHFTEFLFILDYLHSN